MLRPDREGYGLMGIRDAWREVAPMLSLGAPSVALPKRGRSGPSFASRDAKTVDEGHHRTRRPDFLSSTPKEEGSKVGSNA